MLRILMLFLVLGSAPAVAEVFPLRSMYGKAVDSSQKTVVSAELHPLDKTGSILVPGAKDVSDMLLVIRYHERDWGTYGLERIYVCMTAPKMTSPTPNIFVAFILGRKTIFGEHKMNPHRICSNSGGGPQNPGMVEYTIRKSQDENFWNQLFPPKSNGTRWYAMQLAFKGVGLNKFPFGNYDPNYVIWDSNYGNNYPVIFK